MVHTLDKWLLHMITRSLKENTGFTEIPGRLGKAHLLGQMVLFLKALMVLPLMDFTMNASNTFFGIIYKKMVSLDLLPMEEHLPKLEASRPQTFFSFLRALWYFCPLLHRLVLWQSPLTARMYPLILHIEISQEWVMICSCIGVSN